MSVLLAEEMNRAQEKARLEEERLAEEKRASHVRPWDRGKCNDDSLWHVPEITSCTLKQVLLNLLAWNQLGVCMQ